MESSPPPLQPPPAGHRPNMDLHLPVTTEDPASSTSLWDWDDLLDFSVDFPLSLDSDQNDQSPTIPQPPPPENLVTDRVRKRDPRLTCSNFLSGRVPCACPELDELMEREAAEEEEARGGTKKKRVRVSRPGPRTTARCQVEGCEADISELKGYHKRHRVCLRCANATAVLLDGETKRYCQQCGKFHLLSNFDEGKRSCRRKLEHHNRRRRKILESRGAVDKKQQLDLQTEDPTCDGEAGKDTSCINNQIVDEEALFESEDGHVSDIHLASKPQKINTDSVASFMASGETQMDRGRNDSKFSQSPSDCDNKSAYSSMCPTGRISFKLYDWNPAEFPRRLRLQIFQWLASMPVELEGYIRPGCTILTMFIAMPTFMWEKLFKSPVSYVEDFVVPPGRMLSGRGCIIVYLNDLIFRVMEGGASVMKVSVKVRAPRLHYIYPTCFEAGKPMEFLVCGTNLLQPKFRFLVSFAGKYLASDYRVASPRGRIKGDSSSFDHQLYEIYIPHTEPNSFGPAFVEVENESGLSNFIPVLIGDKEICSEIKTIQQRFDASFSLERSQFAASGSLSDSCEVATLSQTAFSELLLDIAWLLKEPASEDFQQIMVTSQIQRFNCLLNFLIHNESIRILEKLLANIKIMMDKMGSNNVLNGTSEADMRLLQKYMDKAREILHQKFQKSGDLSLRLKYTMPKDNCSSQSFSQSDVPSVVPIPNQVENESGLSNFIPVLIGDKEICSEIKTIQQRFDVSFSLERSQFAASSSLSDSCEVATLRQTAFSELLLDIAWLLKEPASEDFQQIMVSSQIQRFNCLLNFLIHNESTIILEKLLANIKIMMDKMGSNNVLNGTSEADMRLLQKFMDKGREILHQKFQKSGDLSLRVKYIEPKDNCSSQSCSQSDVPSVVPIPNQDAETRVNGKLGIVAGQTFIDRSETVPLLNKEIVVDVNLTKEWPIKSCGRVFSGTVLGSRPAIFVIATAAVCFGICVVLLHPQKVGEFAVSIRRCLSHKF